jgi:hypothetical protein
MGVAASIVKGHIREWPHQLERETKGAATHIGKGYSISYEGAAAPIVKGSLISTEGAAAGRTYCKGILYLI